MKRLVAIMLWPLARILHDHAWNPRRCTRRWWLPLLLLCCYTMPALAENNPDTGQAALMIEPTFAYARSELWGTQAHATSQTWGARIAIPISDSGTIFLSGFQTKATRPTARPLASWDASISIRIYLGTKSKRAGTP